MLEHRGHTQGGIDDYQLMGDRMKADPAFGFAYPGSVKFKTPQQFIDRAMIGARSLAG